jgi:hypothetical protein
MRIASIHHTERVEQFIMLWIVVSSTVECVLERSPTEALWVAELVNEFQKQEEWHSRLKKSGARVYDLILGLGDWLTDWRTPSGSFGWSRLYDRRWMPRWKPHRALLPESRTWC